MINIKNTLLLSWLFASVGLSAQTLKIDDCYRMAREIFPLVKQYDSLDRKSVV